MPTVGSGTADAKIPGDDVKAVTEAKPADLKLPAEEKKVSTTVAKPVSEEKKAPAKADETLPALPELKY
jgi:hypothetical protein